MSLTDKCALSLSTNHPPTSIDSQFSFLSEAETVLHQDENDFDLQSVFSNSTDKDQLGLAMSLMNPDELTG